MTQPDNDVLIIGDSPGGSSATGYVPRAGKRIQESRTAAETVPVK